MPDFSQSPWISGSVERVANPEPSWEGERGFVQNPVMSRYDDLASHSVYACGNPIMIEQARAQLVEHWSLAPGNFHSNAFVFSSQSAATLRPIINPRSSRRET